MRKEWSFEFDGKRAMLLVMFAAVIAGAFGFKLICAFLFGLAWGPCIKFERKVN